MKKIFIGLIFLLHFPCSYSYTHKYFQCPGLDMSLNCPKKCELIGRIKFEIKPNINPDQIYLTYESQNKIETQILKECKVNDSKNWSCTTNEIFLKIEHIMSDGKYFSSSVYRMLDGKDDERFTCGIN